MRSCVKCLELLKTGTKNFQSQALSWSYMSLAGSADCTKRSSRALVVFSRLSSLHSQTTPTAQLLLLVSKGQKAWTSGAQSTGWIIAMWLNCIWDRFPLFLQLIFIEPLLCARKYSRHLKYNHIQNKDVWSEACFTIMSRRRRIMYVGGYQSSHLPLIIKIINFSLKAPIHPKWPD